MRLYWSVLLIFVPFLGSPALALNPELSLVQLKHTRWTAENGAPSRIYALAQDRDGFLWLASGDGVFRFDGVNFDKIPDPTSIHDGPIATALLSARDGSMWVGYGNGQLANYRGGSLHDASTPLSDTFVLRLLQTSDGAIWAVIGREKKHLLRFSDDRWSALDAGWGLPPEQIIDAHVARDDSLWVTTIRGLLVLRHGGHQFQYVGATTGSAAISEDPKGGIWVSDDTGTHMRFPVDGALLPKIPTPPASRSFQAIFDEDGSLWGANGAGIFRATGVAGLRSSRAPRVEEFQAVNGLSSDYSVAINEDREGDIWVSTSRGLDMFRNATVVTEPALTGVGRFGDVLLAASNGDVYAGTHDGVFRIKPRGGAVEPALEHVPDIRAMCEGPIGTIWVFLLGRFLEIRGTSLIPHPYPAAGETGIQNCGVDGYGNLWANGQEAGLFRWTAGAWSQPSNPNALSMAIDHAGRLLMLLPSGALVRADNDGHTQSVLFHGKGAVGVLYAAPDGIFVSGGFGLARVQNNNARILLSSRFPWLRDVSSMVETPEGQIWLASKVGIVEVDATALDSAFETPGISPKPIILTFGDGLPDFASRSGHRIGAVRGGDGRVWIDTLAGIVSIDPRQLHGSIKPPQVAIRSVVAGNILHQDPRQISLAAGVSRIAIQYSGLSLSIPERVHFRYRLDGVDNGWVDAGTRREAFYTNLAPGSFQFHVIAANGDSPWSKTGATVAFTIAPTFVQSIWFKVIVGLAVAALVWLIYSLRLRQHATRLQRQFDVRVAERERIARELHDTLLQGCQGLLLRFQSIANRLPPDNDLRNAMEEALGRADAVLAEGRARVRELRGGAVTSDFAQSLVEAASNIIGGDAPRFRLTVEGEPRMLNPLAREEILRIVEEAVRNTVRHARATTVDVLLDYGHRSLRLSVRDDGVGIAQAHPSDHDRNGHYGLIGMHERAKRIGGQLEITSRESAGTEVVMSVPARTAYDVHRVSSSGSHVRPGEAA